MKRFKFYSIFALIIGISMIGLWLMLLTTSQVPELETAPYEITLHLIAEFSTAILLIISATLLFIGNKKGHVLINIAYGMLLYTLIVSSGYYLDLSNRPMALMFGVMFVLSIVAVLQHLRESAL